MNKDNTEALMKSFTQHKGFMPLYDVDGEVNINENVNVMIKDYLGNLIIIELIDGDLLSESEIKQHLKEQLEKIISIKKVKAIYSFEIFIFQREPQIEKINIIEANQVNNLIGRKSLKCITVNLEKQSILNHFKAIKGDFGITNHLNKYFSIYREKDTSLLSFKEIIHKKREESEIKFKSKKPFVTYILIVLNILIFALMSLYSQKSGISFDTLLLNFGAKENIHILQGEYWRFITPILLHASIIHVALNCYCIYIIGIFAEKVFGNVKFSVIYFSAGILGNIFSFAFMPNLSVGASGAIFGLFGAILFICIEKPALFKTSLGHNIVFLVCINLFYGFTNSGIDSFAHVGGLIGGFLLAGIINSSEKKHWYFNRCTYLVLAVIITSSTVLWGFNNHQSKAIKLVTKLEQYDKSGNWTEVEKTSKEILQLNQSKDINMLVLKYLINGDIYLKKYDDGVNYSKDLIKLDPKDGHYVLGVVYYNMKQLDLSKEELLKGKQLGANYSNIDSLLKNIDSINLKNK